MSTRPAGRPSRVRFRVLAFLSGLAAITYMDRVAISAYLGSKDTFDQAIADFAATYADQNERDHAALRVAVDSRRVEAVEGV
jgi:hypothetical protein